MSDIKEIRKMHEESGMENIDSRHIFALFKEIDELQQQVCDECDPDNYGWKHNAVEGRHPCTCIVESGAYQELKQQLDAVRKAFNIPDWQDCVNEGGPGG